MKGGQVECDNFICCQDEYVSGEKAGEWGTYTNCDAPIWLLENMFRDITQKHEVSN